MALIFGDEPISLAALIRANPPRRVDDLQSAIAALAALVADRDRWPGCDMDVVSEALDGAALACDGVAIDQWLFEQGEIL